MRALTYALLAALALATRIAAPAAATSASISVHVPRKPDIRKSVDVSFHASPLPSGGYYYAVIALEPYRHHTHASPPPCATSSNMQRTDYGHPRADSQVALALTPASSRTRHWCRGGTYAGAIYAVPHPPPCNSTYPCRSETWEEPCAGVRPGCVLGVVARPREWAYPEGPPAPRAYDSRIVARFSVKFPR